MNDELKRSDVKTDKQKTDQLLEQALDITELKVEMRELKGVVEEIKTYMADVKKTTIDIRMAILQMQIDVRDREGKKPSWMITIALTLLTGLVSALGVYVLTTAAGK